MIASPEAGVTLLELVVALAIMVSVTAMALPAVDRARTDAALDRVVAAVIADLDRAREAALRTNTAQAVVPDLSRAGSATATATTFSFRPDGTGHGGPLTIVAGTRRIVVSLDPLTGLARQHAER